MTEEQTREPYTQRARLGQELRRIRMLAGLSGRDISRATGISQPTVSRIERGESVPSLPEVTSWANATEITEDRRALVLSLTEAAVNEVTPLRNRLANGLPEVQEEVRGLEATARTLRNFQPGIIPGLLQTAEYARRILTLADPTADVAQAITTRLQRQQILQQPGRSFEFLLTEAALHYRPGPKEVLVGQLDHISAVVTLEQISFGVIPLDSEMHAITRCSFILYEDRIEAQPPFVIIETPHASVYANDPADVQIYRDQLEAFRYSAVYGTEALEIVRSIAHP